MAEVAIPRQMFQEILRQLIAETAAAAATSASVRRSMIMRSTATNGGLRPNARENGQISPSTLFGTLECRKIFHTSHSGFRAIQKSATIHVSSGVHPGDIAEI